MEKTKIEIDIKNNGYCIIPKFINVEYAKEIRKKYYEILKTSSLHSQDEKFHFEDLKLRPWRKTAVGSSNGLGTRISQVLQTTYIGENFFPTDSIIYLTLQKLINLRNILTNIRQDFGSNPNYDGYWNALRFHHYPSGGGHMSQHHDSHFPKILAKSKISFIQLSLCLSNKGEHFKKGGGYVIDKANKKIYVENEDSLGSLVIFDGSYDHGVEDIDGDKVLDWTNPFGRISLFSNLYQVLT